MDDGAVAPGASSTLIANPTTGPSNSNHSALILDAIGDHARARAELDIALDLNPWFTFHDRPSIDAFAARLGVTPRA